MSKKIDAYQIREIKPEDNHIVSQIIKKVMTEYKCVGVGYSINDPEVEKMYEAYANEGAVFFVIENETNKKILGCGGIAPLSESDKDTCELRKMYFLKELRGYGMGQKLLDICVGAAIEKGYTKCYLETVSRMTEAGKLYTKNGFKKLSKPMGNTGHSSCDLQYLKTLKAHTPFEKLLG